MLNGLYACKALEDLKMMLSFSHLLLFLVTPTRIGTNLAMEPNSRKKPNNRGEKELVN